MPTYIALVDFTEQGVQHIEESPARADRFVEQAAAMGGTVKDIYWTTGAHDGVVILEAPGDEAASAILLSLARTGNVRTRTLRAYGRDEIDGIVGKVV